MSQYAKFVTFQALPGEAAVLLGILTASKQLAGEAPGHQRLIIGVSKTSIDTVYVFDMWESRDAHDAFQRQPHQIDLVSRAIPLLLAEPIRQEIDVQSM